MPNPIQDKTILLGVTGSIACYKAADLASKLSQQGAPLPPELQEFGPTSQAAAFALAEATKARSVLEALAKAPQPSRRLELPLEEVVHHADRGPQVEEDVA